LLLAKIVSIRFTPYPSLFLRSLKDQAIPRVIEAHPLGHGAGRIGEDSSLTRSKGNKIPNPSLYVACIWFKS
jgi:hypothetical protein